MNKLSKMLINVIFAASLLLMVMNTKAAELNFSVTPVIPNTQVDTNKSYFDLKLGAGQNQELEVKLVNSTDKSISVETTINRATTNLNGVVEYGETNTEKDSSMMNNIEDYVQISEDEVVLTPNEEKVIKLNVIAPTKEFGGIIAGGITFKEKTTTAETEVESDSLAIKNEYAYVVGIVLHGSMDVGKPELVLNNVEASQVNSRNVINANLQNKTATYLNKMEIVAKVTKKGYKDILYSVEKKDMQMAPNSNFYFPISLEGKRLEAGTYTLEMIVTAVNDKWEFNKDFSINKETADKYNEVDVSIENDDNYMYMGISISIIFVIGLICYLIYLYRKKENKYKTELEELKKANESI